MSEEGVCCKIIFLCVQDKKKFFCENRHEAFILLKLFVVETGVVCQKLIHVYA